MRRLVLPSKYGRIMFCPEEIINIVEDTRTPGKSVVYTPLWQDGVEVTLAFDDLIGIYMHATREAEQDDEEYEEEYEEDDYELEDDESEETNDDDEIFCGTNS